MTPEHKTQQWQEKTLSGTRPQFLMIVSRIKEETGGRQDSEDEDREREEVQQYIT